MANICYIAHSHPFWRQLAKELGGAGYNIKMWVGNADTEEFAKETFPEAIVYPFVATHKGGTFQHGNVSYSVPAEIYTSPEFMRLRDQVYKMMNRQDDFGRFRLLEREAVFYSLFAFFYSELKKHRINLCLASEAPHSPATYTIYGLCKMMGIKRVHLVPIRHTTAMLMQHDFSDRSLEVPRREKHALKQEQQLLHSYLDTLAQTARSDTPYYMKEQKAKDKPSIMRLPYLFKSFQKRTKKGVLNFVAHRYRRITKPHYTIKTTYFLNDTESFNIFTKQYQKSVKRHQKRVLRRRYIEFAADAALRDQGSYVYLPLHHEPEKTTNPDGGKYYNTYDMLLALRAFVPQEIPIYVKEHPSQLQPHHMHGNRGRSPYFYDFCKQLPNVYLLPFSIDSQKIFNNATIVATTTGTAAIEAACREKKALLFGFPWFSGCPNTFHISRVKNFESLVQIPSKSVKEIKVFLDDKLETCGIRACCYEEMRGSFEGIANVPFDDRRGIQDILAALETVVLN